MEFYDVINARHMVREWKSEDISMEALKRILAAGLKAPTHDHRRNWEFIILHGQQEKEAALQFAKAWSVSQEEQKKVSALGSIPQRMYAYAMPHQYSMLVTAPYVVIPLFKGAGIWGRQSRQRAQQLRFHLVRSGEYPSRSNGGGPCLFHAHPRGRRRKAGHVRSGCAGGICDALLYRHRLSGGKRSCCSAG